MNVKTNNKTVYLLYPPISKLERYSSDIGSVGGEQIPLGIFYLASYLRKNNYVVHVTDAEALKMTTEEVVKEIKELNPNFVGISSSTVAFHRALEVATQIKKDLANVVTIIGGPHVTSNVNHAMSFGVFDFGVLREGEITALELLDAISNKRPIDRIEGITYLNREGKVVVNPLRDYIANLDELPIPAYDLIKDIGLYSPPPSNYRTLPVVNIITSRGCPNQCTFCDRNVFGKKYRERSAENVFEEIKYLYARFGIKEIAFVDDTFLINKKRIYELFDLIRKKGMKFHWTCMARINNVDYDFLKYLKDNGCWNIAFGIESGDENILKVIRKNISLSRVTEVIEWCYKLKIKTKGFFIVGHPLETADTIDKTIQFALKLKLDAVVVTINTPIPGSPQYEEASQYGSIDTTDWSKFNYWRPVFVPHGLSQELLLKKQKEFYLRFYLRPSIIFRYMLSFIGPGGYKRFKSILNLKGYLC
jgi:radical SAM superfamily enzyme YgiQ (UPF0313 family)